MTSPPAGGECLVNTEPRIAKLEKKFTGDRIGGGVAPSGIASPYGSVFPILKDQDWIVFLMNRTDPSQMRS